MLLKYEEKIKIIDLSKNLKLIKFFFKYNGSINQSCNKKRSFCRLENGHFPPILSNILLDLKLKNLVVSSTKGNFIRPNLVNLKEDILTGKLFNTTVAVPLPVTGALIQAYFSDQSTPSAIILKRLTTLRNMLSTEFCSSLSSHTIHLRPMVIVSDRNVSLWIQYFPPESFCTEQLNNLINMLPCRAESGIATLLRHPSGADWTSRSPWVSHTLEAHVTQTCHNDMSSNPDQEEAPPLAGDGSLSGCDRRLQLSFRVQAVLTTAEPLHQDLLQTIMQLNTSSDTTLLSTCRAAQLPPVIQISENLIVEQLSANRTVGYLTKGDPLSVQLRLRVHRHSVAEPPPVESLVVTEPLTPLLHLLLHSYQYRYCNDPMDCDDWRGGKWHSVADLLSFSIQPSCPGGGCLGSLRWEVPLPQQGALMARCRGRLQFLRLSALPTTAFLAPALLTVSQHVIATAPLPLRLPAPDASMAFNVFTLIGCLMAGLLGSVINRLTRHVDKQQQSYKPDT